MTVNNENEYKRAAAIHDLSGVGKCSLTVILPILSAAGIECAALPTAVLSTHTGGFGEVVCRDLTEDMLPIARHWRREHIGFDALYSGYLASYQQIGLVRETFGLLRGSRTLVMVDPVMGDNGRLYSLYTPEMARGMADLCACADIIVPNLTEAAILLGRDYRPRLTPEETEETLRALSRLGPRRVVLTGVHFREGELGAACYDAGIDRMEYEAGPAVPGRFHGTGDVFASVLLAGLLHGNSLAGAVRLAVSFTAESIRRTADAGTDPRFGVRFEPGLTGLAERINGKNPGIEWLRNRNQAVVPPV